MQTFINAHVNGSPLSNKDILSENAREIINRTPSHYRKYVEYVLLFTNRERLADKSNLGAQRRAAFAATILEDQVSVYVAGLVGATPLLWEAYEKRFLIENDPEYGTYLRLKEKFG